MPFNTLIISHINIKNSKNNTARIVLAEGDDIRVIEAAARARDDNIAKCILIGKPESIESEANIAGFNLQGIRLVDPQSSPQLSSYTQNLFELRSQKGMTREQAEVQVLDPLYFADLMLQAGDADGSIAGARYTTGDRVRTALQIVGIKPGFKTVSSFFLMVFDAEHHNPKRTLLFSDCALMVNPDTEQLAEIAITSAASARKFIELPPRVALLSFSSDGSAKHKMVDKVREATKLVRIALPDTPVDGEIQLDAAIVPEISARKFANSQTRGQANVLVFPDLNAANIGYKIAQRFGGAKAIGPILQGLKKPANDLSRGCSADDVYELIGLTARQMGD